MQLLGRRRLRLRLPVRAGRGRTAPCSSNGGGALATAALAVFAHGLVLLAADTRMAAGGSPSAPPGRAPLVLAVLGRERRGRAAGRGAREPARNRAPAHRRSPAGAHPGSLAPLAAPPAYGREPDERPAHHGPRRAASPRSIRRPSASPASPRRPRSAATWRPCSPGSGSWRWRSKRARRTRAFGPPTRSERGERLHLGLGAYVLKDAEGVALRARGDLPGRDAGGRDGARAAALGAARGDRPALGEHRARDPQSPRRDLRLDPGAAASAPRRWPTTPRRAG